MSPFDPIGERARWRVIYDNLVNVPVDGVMNYEQMGQLLDLDPATDRHAIQMAMRRAGRELLEVDSRAVESVPNVGYRIVQANEHLRLAQQQQRRSRKALVRGRSTVVHVDMNALEPETRKAFEVVGRAFSMMVDMHRRLDTRQHRLAQAVEEIVGRTDRSEAEIAALKERLAKLEGGDAKPCCWRCTPTYPLMLLCPECGNKRCPRANDHDNTCTGSNRSGQPGSAYA